MSTSPDSLPSTEARPPLWLLVGTGIVCTLVVVVFARLAYGLLLPPMREALDLSYTQAANLGTVTALGYLSLVMVAGVFAARFGPRRSILLGLALAATGFSGLAFAEQYFLLVALMALLGFATAFAYTPLISLLGAWYPDRRGMVIGLSNSGVGLGMLLSGALIPFLTALDPAAGWRSAWALFGVAAAAALALVYLVVRDPPIPGRKPNASVAPASVYRNPHVLTIGLIYGIVGITYIVQSIFMYSFALESGISPQTAGRFVALMGFISIFAGPSWGWTADRIGHANALIICMTLSLIGTAAPIVWPVTAAFALHYLLLGVAVTGLFTSILAASTSTVEPIQAPVAVSYVTLFFAGGQLIGPALTGLLIIDGSGFRLVFTLSVLLMIVGIGLSAFSARARRSSLQAMQQPY